MTISEARSLPYYICKTNIQKWASGTKDMCASSFDKPIQISLLRNHSSLHSHPQYQPLHALLKMKMIKYTLAIALWLLCVMLNIICMRYWPLFTLCLCLLLGFALGYCLFSKLFIRVDKNFLDGF